MTLEEVIKQRLAEATALQEEKKVVKATEVDPEEVSGNEVVDTKPKLTKEDVEKVSIQEALAKDVHSAIETAGWKHSPEHTATFSKKVNGGKAFANNVKSFVHPKSGAVLHSNPDDNMIHVDHKGASTSYPLGDGDNNHGATDMSKVKKVLSNHPIDDKKNVSEQVSALLETEGLSEEFKQEAVTIFEAAIADKVMLIEAKLKEEFDSQLAEAKAELDNDIDGFLSEAVQQWKQDNEVAIKSTFKSQVAESFIDGMKALIAEHNIEVPEEKEDALEVALSEVDKLNESIVAHDAAMQELQEQVNVLKAEKILESFNEKMTRTEFDRFVQLTESIKFFDESQYEKQLNVVLGNFGAKGQKQETTENVPIVESAKTIITESNSDMTAYASFIAKQRV